MIDCNAILRNYSRYLLIVFNFFFVLTGVIIISVGISAKAYFNEFDQLLNDKYFYISDLLIVIGIIIFFIAFFGCCGAVKENACMTTTFSTLLIVIFILEALAGIGGIVLKGKTEEFIGKKLTDTLILYNTTNNTEITETWDVIQSKFQCCGVHNYTDWYQAGPNTNKTLPISCCQIPPGSAGLYECNKDSKGLHHEGCLVEFGDFIKENISSIEIAGITLAIVQLLGIVLSCYLAKQIRRDYETV